jgi:putative ABC transport system permease protein
VRFALGAAPARIVALAVRQEMAWIAGGVAVGALGARLLSRPLESLRFQVEATGDVTFIAGAAAARGVALIASAMPAIRASRADPMLALRSE